MVAILSIFSVSTFGLLALQGAKATPTPGPGLNDTINQIGNGSFVAPSCPCGLLNVKNCGTDASCLCNDTSSTDVFNCLKCNIGVDTSTNEFNLASSILDGYVSSCKQAGFTVKAQNQRLNGALAIQPGVIGLAGMALAAAAMLL